MTEEEEDRNRDEEEKRKKMPLVTDHRYIDVQRPITEPLMIKWRLPT